MGRPRGGNMNRLTRMVILAPLVFGILASAAQGQTVRIGSAGLSGELLPLWVAQTKGLFKKHGLNTEVITFQGGPPTVQSLLAGEIKFHVGGARFILGARIAGGGPPTA